MDKTFDDLFNDFFDKNDDNTNSHEENIEKFIDMITNYDEVDSLTHLNNVIDSLGEANTVEYYEEDGMFFEKRTWEVPGGNMVKIKVSEEPFNTTPEEPSLTLDEQLEEAIKNEDYEIAANIRDAIKKEEKKQKKLQKNLTK